MWAKEVTTSRAIHYANRYLGVYFSAFTLSSLHMHTPLYTLLHRTPLPMGSVQIPYMSFLGRYSIPSATEDTVWKSTPCPNAPVRWTTPQCPSRAPSPPGQDRASFLPWSEAESPMLFEAIYSCTIAAPTLSTKVHLLQCWRTFCDMNQLRCMPYPCSVHCFPSQEIV